MNKLQIRRVALSALFATLTFATGLVQANGSVYAKVTAVRIDASGMGMVFFDQQVTGSPSCVTGAYAYALAFSGSGGKSVMALALWAKTTNTSISVYGTGACNVYGGIVEDWFYGL